FRSEFVLSDAWRSHDRSVFRWLHFWTLRATGEFLPKPCFDSQRVGLIASWRSLPWSCWRRVRRNGTLRWSSFSPLRGYRRQHFLLLLGRCVKGGRRARKLLFSCSFFLDRMS